jgi:hypothetical protein
MAITIAAVIAQMFDKILESTPPGNDGYMSEF